jgi:hypothetical protein
MQFLRQKLGPNVLTFCEHQSDTIMPYSGGYSETTFTPGEDDSPGSYRLWSDSDNWRIYQWLCPGCQLASRLYHGTPRRSDLDPDQWFYRANITPLLPTDNFPLWLFSISDIENKYVNPDGSWR